VSELRSAGNSPKYRDVVFIQDPAEFDKWYVDWDDSKEDGFAYLLQWENGDDIPLRDVPSWGTYDTIEYFMDGDNTYAVSYNWHLSYVSLTEIVS
jgi:hypothetical protein